MLMSCAAPKAIIVLEAPVPKTEKKEESAALPDPAVPGTPDDGIRLPDMLGLPEEGEFRNAGATAPSRTGAGAVIARPPSEPKPKP